MKPFGGEKIIPLLLLLHHPIMPLPLQQFMCRWAWLICLISLWSPAPRTDREKKNNRGELISTQPFIYLLQALKKPFLAGLRIGEAFQTTEILVSSGERTPCQLDSPNAYSGKTDFRKQLFLLSIFISSSTENQPLILPIFVLCLRHLSTAFSQHLIEKALCQPLILPIFVLCLRHLSTFFFSPSTVRKQWIIFNILHELAWWFELWISI